MTNWLIDIKKKRKKPYSKASVSAAFGAILQSWSRTIPHSNVLWPKYALISNRSYAWAFETSERAELFGEAGAVFPLLLESFQVLWILAAAHQFVNQIHDNLYILQTCRTIMPWNRDKRKMMWSLAGAETLSCQLHYSISPALRRDVFGARDWVYYWNEEKKLRLNCGGRTILLLSRYYYPTSIPSQQLNIRVLHQTITSARCNPGVDASCAANKDTECPR